MLILQNLNQLDGDGSNKNIRASGFNNGIFVNGGFTDAQGNLLPQADSQTVTTAFKYIYTTQTDADSASGQFRTTEDLRAVMQQDANKIKAFGGDSAAAAAGIAAGFGQSSYSVSVILNNSGQFEINNKQDGIAMVVIGVLMITLISLFQHTTTRSTQLMCFSRIK